MAKIMMKLEVCLDLTTVAMYHFTNPKDLNCSASFWEKEEIKKDMIKQLLILR